MTDPTPAANVDPFPPADAADAAPAESATPPDALESALLEVAQWRDAALRAAAELDNYRKRMAREMQDAVRFSNAGLLESLLPVRDNFDYGLMAAKAENEGSTIFVGFSMVLRQMHDFLKDNGVEEISIAGPFDPNIHDAVSQQPSDSVPEGAILQQTRRGYKLRDRLLRPASVIVSSGPAAV